MNITKYAHACLLIETNGARIIVDPGMWNKTPEAVNVDAILITHEHQDHCDVAQIRAILSGNPGAIIITHEAVAALLEKEGLSAHILKPGESVSVKDVSVESYGSEHAVIYGASPCRNTGFLIGGELFIPGDALHDVPPKTVRVLALPTGGPWMKMAEAIDYAKRIKPAVAFPIHDAMYTEDYQRGLVPRLAKGFLEPDGITFVDMPAGTSHEF